MNPPPDHLKKKALVGTGWVAGTILVSRALQSLGGIFLLRLLEPTMFGLFGMVMAYLGIVSIGTDLGLRQAIIQRPNLEGEELHEALQFFFVTYLVKGILLSLITWTCAPLAARFFQTPEVTWMIKTSALCLIARSAISPGTLEAERNMDLRKVELVIQASRGVALIATLSFAFYLRSAWALLLGTLIGDWTHVFLSFWVFPFAMRRRPYWIWIRRLLHFAKHSFLNQVFNTAILQTDKLIVARMLDKTAFGFFDKAQNIMALSAVQLAQVMGKVGFPMFSQLSKDPHRAGRAWLKLLRYTSTFAIPPFIVVAVFAPALVSLLLQPHWLPIIPLLQIFSLYSIMRILSLGTAAMLMGLGYPQIPAILKGVRLSLLLGFLPFAIQRFGVLGAAWWTSMAFVLTTTPAILACIWKGRPGRATARQLLQTPLIANLSLTVFSLCLQGNTPNSLPWLAVNLLASGLFYAGILLFDKEFRTLPAAVLKAVRQWQARR
ncbi:MAG: oligosaccharide flippase family protein [Verrucomicrobiota bacterium]|nr:oligosaccharide flippase family protein [Verrucomicrobiota bacterium]